MVSVCLATYNGELYIKEQLSSILSQLQPNDEIVISDDGSTDSTLSIIGEFNDSRIRVLHHKKTDVTKFRFDYTTHNFENAINHAKGDYIFLSDQDDVWLPYKVITCLDALKHADVVISDKVVVDKDLYIIKESTFLQSKQSVRVFHNLMSPNNPGCCMAFKRHVCEKIIPIPKYGVAQDVWIALLGGIYFKVDFINKPLILFRRHDNNVSTSLGTSNDTIAYRIKYRAYTLFALIRKCGLIKVILNW